jgi:hypothetical protein
MGVVLWNQINFDDPKLSLSSDVYSGSVVVDPTISIKYEIGKPGTVQITIKDTAAALGLPVPVQDKLADGLKRGGKAGMKVTVKLGYLDEPWNRPVAFDGRIELIEAQGGNSQWGMLLPAQVILTGTEEAAFKLQAQKAMNGEKEEPKKATLSLDQETPEKAVQRVLGPAKLTVTGKVEVVPAEGESEITTLTRNLEGGNAFELLTKLADPLNAEALVQDGMVLFGSNLKYPADAALPFVPDPSLLASFFLKGDSLIVLNTNNGMVAAPLAEFKPFQLSGAKKTGVVNERPPPSDVEGFDFTAAGTSVLRAGQLVAASVQGYQDPFKPYRILSVEHSYAPDTGYVCKGRAVKFIASGKSNRAQSDLARKASPLSVADKIAGKAKEATTSTSVAIDVGRVSKADAAGHTVTVQYGQKTDSTIASPSVDADIEQKKSDDDTPTLKKKPVASPFAWHKVGLSLPSYTGMRAVLSSVRGARDDSVVTGYLWANKPKMEPPPAKDGDWWLCLPTEVSGTPPLPSGEGANDLTASDGRRVIEAVGLKIVVGKASCTKVGKRPTEGNADVLLISHKSGTTVEIDADGNVTVDGSGNVTVDGKQKVVLKAGGATLTIGDGKVAIS